jgi:hypothetical protein
MFSLLIITGCGSGARRYSFYNENYVLQKQDNYSVAIFPPPDSISLQWCDELTEAYNNASLHAIPCDSLYDQLHESNDFRILLNKTTRVSYPDSEITYTPNLLEILTSDELLLLREYLHNSDFFIIALCMPMYGEISGYVLSSLFTRMFDLKSGELIFDKYSLMPIEEEDADLNTVLEALAALSYAHFDHLFWRPFVLGERDSTKVPEQ